MRYSISSEGAYLGDALFVYIKNNNGDWELDYVDDRTLKELVDANLKLDLNDVKLEGDGDSVAIFCEAGTTDSSEPTINTLLDSFGEYITNVTLP